jgi:hypothetical protein
MDIIHVDRMETTTLAKLLHDTELALTTFKVTEVNVAQVKDPLPPSKTVLFVHS